MDPSPSLLRGDVNGALKRRHSRRIGLILKRCLQVIGLKLLRHPVGGDLDLPFESFRMAGDLSQSLLTYTPEPRSPTEDALNLLASWAATATVRPGPAPSAGDAETGLQSRNRE